MSLKLQEISKILVSTKDTSWYVEILTIYSPECLLHRNLQRKFICGFKVGKLSKECRTSGLQQFAIPMRALNMPRVSCTKGLIIKFTCVSKQSRTLFKTAKKFRLRNRDWSSSFLLLKFSKVQKETKPKEQKKRLVNPRGTTGKASTSMPIHCFLNWAKGANLQTISFLYLKEQFQWAVPIEILCFFKV